MTDIIGFGKADVIAEGSNTDIDTSEETIVEVTDNKYTTFSQLSLYGSLASLGTHTSLRLRVYHLDEVGGTYRQLCKVNTSTGAIEDNYYAVDSSTPAEFLLDIPMSASFGFKVTGQGVAGANASVTVKLLGRNN